MKLLLDTNVWRRVNTDYIVLKNKLIQKDVEVFLSETVFTLESVQKESKNGNKGRLEFFQEISQNEFGLNPYLQNAINDTQDLNIKILRAPRIGMPFNVDLPKEIFYRDRDVHDRMDRMGTIERDFPDAGYEAFKKYIESLNISAPWQTHMDQISSSEERSFAKAIAEWADGDTVSACYGYNIDVLCTADRAQNAGTDSIFSEANTERLKDEYRLTIKTPDELTSML